MAQDEPVAGRPPPKSTDDVLIRRGRVASVDLYEIKDTELEALERGSPADVQFNFAVFLISTALNALAALATATFQNERVQTTFIVLVVVGLIGGGYLLVSWWRDRKSLKEIAARIRSRISPDVGSAGQGPPPPPPA